MPSNQRTLEQERGKAAWDDVSNINTNLADEKKKKYRGLVRSFPSLIMISGLGQALAFLQAKGDPEHNALTQHLSKWVLKQMGAQSKSDLLQWVLDTDRSTNEYRRATTETLAYLIWLKRFSEAVLPQEEG